MWLFNLSFFLNSANLICRDTDISKYFREPFGLRDNESRLYLICVTSILPINFRFKIEILAFPFRRRSSKYIFKEDVVANLGFLIVTVLAVLFFFVFFIYKSGPPPWGGGGAGGREYLFPCSSEINRHFSCSPNSKSFGFICSLFPKIAFVPLVPLRLDFCFLVPLK